MTYSYTLVPLYYLGFLEVSKGLKTSGTTVLYYYSDKVDTLKCVTIIVVLVSNSFGM